MEKLAIPSYSFGAKNYCLLTKPGIILGNSIATAGGFALAARGSFDVFLFIAAVLGLGFLIGSSCVFNNYIDREADRKMERTRNRGLATGAVSSFGAILFATALGLIGTAILLRFTNRIAVAFALTGFFVYVILYSYSKYYSLHGTLIGTIAGAIPPVVGYCAVSGRVDAGAWILFLMMVLWQMPHFFAIAIYRIDDYVEASIPILPSKKGMRYTKIEMMLYIVAFTAASLALPAFGYTGKGYAAIVLFLGSLWVWLCARGFNCKDDRMWARQMFLCSLIVIMALFIAIPFSL